jgi:hypothetical protein
MTKFRYFFVFFCIFLLGCAVQGTLEGGAIDKQAPRIDSLKSSPNFVTKFEKKPIKLTFDEWITLENPQNQVIVSPPLVEKIDLKLNGKTVEFNFGKDEVLRPNATYTINFGESIKDLTAGNKAEIRYVFSTGDAIDSLKIKAQIINSFTREPVENVLFMLYDKLDDSVVVKERPFYFAKSDKTGFCEIQNVRKGIFKAFALEDANVNYKYDLPTEKVGFLSENIDSQDSSKSKVYTIELSESPKKLQLLDKVSSSYGQVKLVFSQEAKNINVTWEDKNQRIFRENDGDTLRIWYDSKTPDAWKIFALKDTVKVKSLSREDFLKKSKLKLGDATKSNRSNQLSKLGSTIVPGKNFTNTWNFPIAKIDTSKIKCLEDSTKKILPLSVSIDTLSARKVHFNAKWVESKKYTLTFLPGAFTDFFEQKNDTLSDKLLIAQRKDYGDLTVNYLNFQVKNQYLVQLTTESGTLVEEKIVRNTAKGKVVFNTLSPIRYKIRVVTDNNKNGKWNGNNYFKKEQSEPIFIKVLEELKPNWELETEIDLDKE